MADTEQDIPNDQPAASRARWGQERRLAFIDFRLQWDGRINRSDLISFFGISTPQASLDIAKYAEQAPANLVYDHSSRVYLATQNFTPHIAANQSKRYLNELLASQMGILDADLSFIGWRPLIGSVPQPERVVDNSILTSILKAIKEHTGLRVVYQSMSSPQPGERTISPHSLAYDGFRWHTRAYCHSRQQFRDFVLGRILEVRGIEPAGPSGEEDSVWRNILTLVIGPNPDLTEAKRRVIELDYGMTNGEVQIQCRQALLFYTLQRLGLRSESAAPEAQQILLKNREELAEYLTQRGSDS